MKKRNWSTRNFSETTSVEEERTLRFKAIRTYIKELDKLLIDDPQIEYITGSATLTPSDAYSV